jgi:hypothetical protein
MNQLSKFLAFLFLFFSVSVVLSAREASNFKTFDSLGERFELFSHIKAKAIVITAHSVTCPIVRQTYPQLMKIARKYKKENIEFWYLNSTLQDDLNSINHEIKNYKINIPILIDKSQDIIKLLGLKVTTETVIINTSNWAIIYKGAISDQVNYGINNKKAIKNYLTDALDNLISNKEIKVKSSRPFGCSISIN